MNMFLEAYIVAKPHNSTNSDIDSAQSRMTSLQIHRAIDRLITNISKIDKTLCGSVHFTMANNLIPQQVQELQLQELLDPPANSDLKTNFSNHSVINEIITQTLVSPGNPMEAPKPAKRVSLRTLARVAIVLNRVRQTVTPGPHETSVDYWRNLAQTRGEMSSRYCQVIEMQRKRIETLERDLRTLIALARETRQMLAEIAVEKRSQDHGDGEDSL